MSVESPGDSGSTNGAPDEAVFSVDLDVYSGPFETLLTMVSSHRLELTELSLSSITEEFLEYVRGLDVDADLEQASAFLDVASILVEAKSAALLPSSVEGSGRDEESLRALQERDLLFARLLQYRAFSKAAVGIGDRLDAYGGWVAHPGSTEGVLTVPAKLVWSTDPHDLASIAAVVIANSPVTRLAEHRLHAPVVDLRGQALLVRRRILSVPRGDPVGFHDLCRDAGSRIVAAARFFSLLVFITRGWLQFRQDGPFEPLWVRWVGDPGDGEVAGEGSEPDLSLEEPHAKDRDDDGGGSTERTVS